MDKSGPVDSELFVSDISVQGSDESPKIALPRAVAVLTNVITGIGLLGIPYCFCTGIGTNFCIMVFIGSFSMFSFSLLIDCSTETGVQDYPRLIKQAFPNKNIQWIPDVIILVTLFGASILYLQFSLSLTINVFEETIENCPSFLTNRWFITFVIQLAFLVPLILLKTMNALSFVSLASVCLVCVYLFHSIYYFAYGVSKEGFDPDNKMKIFDFDLKMIIPALSIQSSSYTCHPNIFPTLSKLANPTKTRLNLTMFLVTLAATFLYSIGGVFPYLTLFDAIKDPVVLNYYRKQTFTIIIKACYALLLVLTAPILLFACRLSANDLIFKSDFTRLRWNLIGVTIVLIDCIISVTVKKLNVMFSLVGGVTSPLLVYILPSLYFLRICKDGSQVKRVTAYISIVIGIAFIIICLYDAIRSIVN